MFYCTCAECGITKTRFLKETGKLTYRLMNLNNNPIQGSFYERELSKTQQEIFRIDRLIRRDYKKKRALVKWKGYSDDFNSWVPFKDLQSI